MEKFDYVELDTGGDAWSNDCSNQGRIRLQNALKGKSISEKTITSVFLGTKFFSIGGGDKNPEAPIKVELEQFFPETGKARIRCVRNIYNNREIGATINLNWKPKPKSDKDYDELLKKYNALENRVAILEKLLSK